MTRASSLIFFRPGDRIGGGFDGCQIDDAALGLGNDFVLDDENVAGFEDEFISPQRLQQFVGERVAEVDFVGKRDGDDAQIRREIDRGLMLPLLHDWFPGDTTRSAHAPSVAVARQATIKRPVAKQSLSAGFAVMRRRAVASLQDCRRRARSRASCSTMHGLPVAWAAARCGLKLSLPKRKGKRLAGRRKTALVPRPSAAGASTEPSAGA